MPNFNGLKTKEITPTAAIQEDYPTYAGTIHWFNGSSRFSETRLISRTTENSNRGILKRLRDDAIHSIPVRKWGLKALDSLPTSFVRSLRVTSGPILVSDDKKSIIRFRTYLRPLYVTKRGKVRYEVFRYPVKMYRLLPSEEEIKLHMRMDKIVKRRNALDYAEFKTGSRMLAQHNNGLYDSPTYGMISAHMWFNDLSFSDCSLTPLSDWKYPETDANLLPTLFSVELEKAELLARSRLFKSIVGREVNFSTELAQIGQTTKMVSDLLTRCAKFIKSVKRGDISAWKDLFPHDIKTVANDFLMIQFGIRPLIGDVRELLDTTIKFLDRNAILHAEGHGKVTLNEPEEIIILDEEEYSYTPEGGGTAYAYLNRSGTKTYIGEVRVKYSVDLKIIDAELRDAFSLGLTTPEETVWELMPWSFVIDWFVNIGELLGRLHSLDGMVPVEVWKTTFIKTSEVRTETITGAPPGSFVPSRPSSYHGFGPYAVQREELKEVVYCKRERTTLPAAFEVRLKNPFSVFHIAEAAALLIQLRSK